MDVRYPAYLSAGAKDMIGRLLKHRPEERLSLTGILQHEWLQQHLAPEVRAKYERFLLDFLCLHSDTAMDAVDLFVVSISRQVALISRTVFVELER